MSGTLDLNYILFYKVAASKQTMKELPETVKRLLAEGANINATTVSKNGDSILHAECRRPDCRIEMVKMLLFFGASIQKTNHNGERPLHLASQNNHSDVVELMIEAEVKLSALDKFGKTPLDYAIQEGHKCIIKLLTEAGATVGDASNDDAADDNAHSNNKVEAPLYPGCSYGFRGYDFIGSLKAFVCMKPANDAKLRDVQTSQWVTEKLLSETSDVNSTDENEIVINQPLSKSNTTITTLFQQEPSNTPPAENLPSSSLTRHDTLHDLSALDSI